MEKSCSIKTANGFQKHQIHLGNSVCKGNILKLYLGSARKEPITVACGLLGVRTSTTLASSQYNHDFGNHFKEGNDDPVVETLRLDQSGSVPGAFRKYSHGQII